MNIAHHVERGHRLYPDKIAIISEDKSYTYKQLDRLVNCTANALRGLGIAKGDRVALFLPNIPEFAIAYLGILKIGAIAVSLNVMLKSAEVSYILNDCAAKAIVTTELGRLQVAEADLHHLKHILIAEGAVNNDIDFADLIANASPITRAVEMQWNSPASIVYTSGTTGFPKGATLSHGNIISNISAHNRCCGMNKNDRLLLYVPLFHCFGQNAIFNAGLNVCATIILQRRFDLDQVLESIGKYQATMFFGVPTVFIRLLNQDTSKYNFSSLRYYFSAAAPMPVEIAQMWQDKYKKVIHEGYGLTEASPCASYNHNFKYKFGSIGVPIANVQMQIVDANGYQVSPGELGEIVIKGSNVMLGYWNRPQETQKVIKNGWLHSGDIGRMDEEGFFYIADRLKDMINVSGFKVYPTEVENVIYKHHAVAEVAIYGLPDPIKGEIVKANIVVKNGHTITEKEIIEFCSKQIATYKVPQTIKFANSLPKNPTGKVMKRFLRDEELAVISNRSLSLLAQTR
ncbi:class I adenylate-forming enzyme family protein [Nostoc sp. NZL]|uniref:class I adenylate-forming enzyme family protein n=1 Tax=Nostoc sp. NZL TaxID=2650612 RepID=UPI0018C4F273|nr:long-chain fatty acid--CoA ligase [Nostoc sp. NZL]MBG1243297.1 long-chain fatty acid--CoA ligase [Nostoc sp. NZL]